VAPTPEGTAARSLTGWLKDNPTLPFSSFPAPQAALPFALKQFHVFAALPRPLPFLTLF
jgi:hypothetical protein